MQRQKFDAKKKKQKCKLVYKRWRHLYKYKLKKKKKIINKYNKFKFDQVICFK